MSEIETTDESAPEEVIEEQKEEKEEDNQLKIEDDEVSFSDLGIDLDSLKLPTNTAIGKPKPKPSLSTNEKRGVGRPPKEDEGLFAWCEEFNYTPGVEFLKLHRLYPRTWEGMSISGFVEEVYEPIDEHWLADRWGGGTYQLDSYQRDTTGRSRKGKTKVIEISGLPKNYMGNDGVPHPLPEAYNNYDRRSHSRRSSEVLRRRMGLNRFRRGDSEPEYEDDDRTERISPTKSIDQPLQDASALYKTIQDTKKSENEALGVLREAQKDVHEQMQRTASQQSEMYKTLLEQQKDEMRRLREEHRTSAANSTAPFKDILQFVTSQANSSGSREQYDALRSAHETAIQSLTREHSQHLDDLRRNFESRHNYLTDELNNLRNQYAKEIERARTDYLDKERSAKDEAYRNYQAQIEILRQQSSDMRESQRDEISNLSREKNEIITGLRQELSELRNVLLSKDHEHRTALMEKESNLKSEFMDRENKLVRQLDKLDNVHKTELLAERQRLKEDFEDRYETKFNSMKETYELRLETLRKETDTKIQYAKERAEALVDSMKKDFESKEILTFERQKLEKESAKQAQENQKLLLETAAQNKDVLNEMSKKQMEDRIRDLESQNRKFEKELANPMNSGDPFQQLQKLGEIKDRLKAHGFISEEDQTQLALATNTEKETVEEKPKDLLGKIMHYGPQLVGPILQRIDAATSVAQQAMEQKQQEVLKSREQAIAEQQRVELERQAALQREQELRQRRQMLQQRRLERESQIQAQQQEEARVRQNQARMQQEALALQAQREAQAQAQREAQAQAQREAQAQAQREAQAQAQREAEQNLQKEEPLVPEVIQETPIHTQEDNEMSSESDGYKQLADYLKKSLDEKKSASGIVGELKMAQMMGYFSKETLREVVSRDYDDLLQILSGHHNSLSSPRARLVLKEVLKGLK